MFVTPTVSSFIFAWPVISSRALISEETCFVSKSLRRDATELGALSFLTRENTGGTIDAALSQPQSFDFLDDEIIEESVHSILNDKYGHPNAELARSIWDWGNSQRLLQSSTDDHSDTLQNKRFPAAQLKFSTRRGLRIVDKLAQELSQRDHYSDLVQEGVVALMSAMAEFDPKEGELRFENYARKQIKDAMKTFLVDSSNAQRRFPSKVDSKPEATPSSAEDKIVSISVEPHDLIVEPLGNFITNKNPTPEDIALVDMIQHDIRDFLDRTLEEKELKIVRLKFGLDPPFVGGMNSVEIANHSGLDVEVVEEMESTALEKLRLSFSDDYIGAYIDNDYTDEVSL